MEKRFCIINEEAGLDCVYKSYLALEEAERLLCDFINGGLDNGYMMDDIAENQAYIAVQGNYVVGACFTQSVSCAEWVDEMIAEGAKVLIVDREAATNMLGMTVDLRVLAA
jgi:hypothetical protein